MSAAPARPGSAPQGDAFALARDTSPSALARDLPEETAYGGASAPLLARRQQRVDELCAAAIRAISGQADLQFRGQRLHRGRSPLPLYAPHLQPQPARADFASFRGAADGLALRLLHSDEALHARLRPADALERLLFELLEQFRCEAACGAPWRGLQRNLRHCFETWSLAFQQAGLGDSARGLLLYTVAQMARSRVSGEPVVEQTEDLIEATRAALAPVIGVDLAGLRRARTDQCAYAVHALSLARCIAGMLRAAGPGEDDPGAQGESDAHAAFALLTESSSEVSSSFATAVCGRSLVLAGAPAYRVFSRAYDRETAAAGLVRKPLLQALRERLDARVATMGVNLAWLARSLRALLAAPVRDGWDGGHEEGQLDGRRLAQLVATPCERRLFLSERAQPVADCALTVLVDCSGSMKEHAEQLAALLDLWVRALEMAGVVSEVLGFTTGAWNGGRAQRDWVRAGRPSHPGRLNELCHMVFKDAQAPWRRARLPMAALLRGELFREGVDGEALQWAARRLAQRGESRKLLLVLSDGSPMDSATSLANDAQYLDHHLRDMVHAVEAGAHGAAITVFGVGVGLDLSPYYRRSLVLDLAGSTASDTLRELLGLLASRARR